MNFKDAFKAFNPISFVTDVLGTGIDAYAQYKGQQQVFEQQKQLMEQQYQNQLDFWNKNNQYNSPANQMKLFEEAGINPYVGISGSNSSTASYGNVMQTPPTPPNLGGVASGAIDRILSLQMQRAQIANMQADVKQKDSNTALNISRSDLVQAQETLTSVLERHTRALAEGQEIKNFYLDEKEQASVDLLVSQNNLLLAQEGEAYTKIDLMDTQIALNKRQYKYFGYLNKLLQTRTTLTEKQIQQVFAQTALTWANQRVASLNGDILAGTKDSVILRSIFETNEAHSKAKIAANEAWRTYTEAELASKSLDYILKERKFKALSAPAQMWIIWNKAIQETANSVMTVEDMFYHPTELGLNTLNGVSGILGGGFGRGSSPRLSGSGFFGRPAPPYIPPDN